MKTIQITAKDQTEYYINPNQITHLYTSKRESGTFIVMSCGNRIITAENIEILKKMIQDSFL